MADIRVTSPGAGGVCVCGAQAHENVFIAFKIRIQKGNFYVEGSVLMYVDERPHDFPSARTLRTDTIWERSLPSVVRRTSQRTRDGARPTRACDDGGRGWRAVAASRGAPRRGGKGPPEGAGPVTPRAWMSGLRAVRGPRSRFAVLSVRYDGPGKGAPYVRFICCSSDAVTHCHRDYYNPYYFMEAGTLESKSPSLGLVEIFVQGDETVPFSPALTSLPVWGCAGWCRGLPEQMPLMSEQGDGEGRAGERESRLLAV